MTAAANLLERAITLLPPGHLDVSLELHYGAALWDCGRLADSVSRAEAAAARADQEGDRIGALQLRLHRGILLLSTDPQGRLEELRSLVAEARPEIEQSTDAARAELWTALTHIAHMEMDTGGELRAANRAVEFARRAGDLLTAQSCLIMAGAAVVYGATPVGEGLTWLDRAAAELPSRPAFLTGWRGYLLALAGRTGEGRALHRQAMQVCSERGQALPAAIMAQEGWQIEMAAGDPAAAERVIRVGCQQLDRMGERGFLSTQAGQLAQALYSLGRYEEAQAWADRGAELAASDDIYTQVLVRQVWLKLAARRGDFAAAQRFADEAVTLVDRTADLLNQGEVALDVAEMLALAGEPAGAAAQLGKAVDRFRAKGATAYVAIAGQRRQQLRTRR
jgi:tetratricopeptide (TPR) repeat protein